MKKQVKGLLGVFIAVVVSFVSTQAAQAQAVSDPIPQLQIISDQMIAALKKNEASMSKKPQVVYDIVRSILLPHVDLKAMARSALGRTAWMSASPAEQAAFSDQFTLLMLKTYAAGLSSYTDESVVFEPIRGGIPAGQTRVEVASKIIRTDGPAIGVNYRLVYEQNDWFVYDFSVEGISMVDSFRSQFASDLSSGVSVPELTAKLKTHNAAVA